jgi:hypothetical protein
MSAASLSDHSQELHALVKRLEGEHRQYPVDISELQKETLSQSEAGRLQGLFTFFQDNLTEHMLLEEFEVYPELMRKNLLDPDISSIMQQHHDVTFFLGKMELSLRLHNLTEFKLALDELAEVLRLHQPVEEEKVFPLAVGKGELSQ